MCLPRGFVNYLTINLTTRTNRACLHFKAHTLRPAPSLMMLRAFASCGIGTVENKSQRKYRENTADKISKRHS
jgi:hypothetical protein